MKKMTEILKMALSGALLFCAIASALPQYAHADEPAPMPSRWMSLDGSSKPVHTVPPRSEHFNIVPVFRSDDMRNSSKELVPPASGERICLVVEDAIYSDITSYLARFITDLEAEGYTVITYRFVSGTAEDLRTYLATLYEEPQSLAGAELIGDIPYIIYEMLQEWNSAGVEYEDFPCDIFYMDLNGTWSDTLTNGLVLPDNDKYDTWTGDKNLEIWVSRMRTDKLPALGSETAILNNYFNKNHSYRQRTLAPASTALIYDDDDWTTQSSGDITAVTRVYTSSGVTAVYDPETTTAADYKTNHLPVTGELVLTRSHGNPSGHGYYQDSHSTFNYVYPQDYRNTDAPALFYGFFVCSGADFTINNNLASSVAFDTSSTTGLFTWGSTKTGGMWQDNYFYTALSQGNCFGKAFTIWFNNLKDNSVAPQWWYGMALIGDAALRTSPKTFTLSISLPTTAEEGDGVIDSQATVSLPWPLDADFKVYLESSDTGEVNVPESLIINAGDRTTLFPLTIVDDNIIDGLQRVTVTASAPHWTSAHDSMTISDRGQTIRFSSATSNANEGQGTSPITLSLSTAAITTLQANYSIAGGTAQAGGTDVALASGTVTFSPGEVTKTITATIFNDIIDEADETVRIALVNIINGVPGDTLFHTLSIIDDDDPPQVTFTSAALSEREDRLTAAIPVTLSQKSGFSVRVDYAVTATTASDAGVDFTLPAGTLSFLPGETTGEIIVELVNDTVEENDESIEITLTNPVNGTAGTTMVHTFTIRDDDRRIVSFKTAEAEGAESMSTVGIDVALNIASTKLVHIGYRVDGGSASGNGEDYTLTDGILSFDPGDTLKTITLAVMDDGRPEADETVQLILDNPVDIELGEDTVFTYTILNDDFAPVITSDSVDTAFEDAAFSYIASVIDPGDTPAIFFDNIPSWLDTASGMILGTPAEGVGDTLFTVIADDGFTADTMTVHLTVLPVNDTPRIITTAVTNAAEHVRYRYDIDALDPDAGDTIIYSLIAFPSGMTVHPVTGEILWFPDSGDIGNTTVTIAVTDQAGAADTQTFELTVINTNDPPDLKSVALDTIATDSLFVYHAFALDPDGTEPVYRFENLPSWLTSVADSIVGTPRRGDRDTVVLVIADDGDLIDTLILRIVVLPPPNEDPLCTLLTITSPQRDTVTIQYVMNDPDSDLLKLELFFELNGQWIKTDNFSGKTASIGPVDYAGSIVWLSHMDIQERLVDSVRVKIIPYDADSGIAGLSNWFAIDNRTPLAVTGTSPLSWIAPFDRKGITVTFTNPIDPVTVDNSVTITGSQSGAIPFTSVINGNVLYLHPEPMVIAAETLTVSLSSQLRGTNGVAIADYSFKTAVAYMGDFNLDGHVGFPDLTYLSEYWYKSAAGISNADSIMEIGPVKGTLPHITVLPDGVFDFEDVDIFIHMWHWSHENVDNAGALAKRGGNGSTASVQKASLRQEMVDGGIPGLRLDLDVVDVSRLVACSYSVSYDPATIMQAGLDTATMLQSDNGEAIVMKTNGKGRFDLDMVRLSSTKRDVSGSGHIAGLFFVKKSGTAFGTVKISYDLVDSDHKSIESGTIELEIPTFDNEAAIPDEGRLTIAPNPSVSASGSRHFQFRNDPLAMRLVSSNDGGFVFSFGITKPVGNKAVAKLFDVEGYIKIYDVMGTVVAFTPLSRFRSGNCNNGCEQFTIYWDGRSSSGTALSPGVYHAALFYKSSAGNGKLTGMVGVKR